MLGWRGTRLASAAQARAATRFSIDLARKIVGVSSPRVSPDGRRAAFVVTRPNYADNRNESELYLVELAKGAPRQLTFERHQVAMPRWSPDGNALAFIAPGFLRQESGVDHADERRRRPAHHARDDRRPALFVASLTAPPSRTRAADEAPQARRGSEAHRHHGGGEQGSLPPRADAPAAHLAPGDRHHRRAASHRRRVVARAGAAAGSPPSELSWSPDGKQIAFARVPLPQSRALRFDERAYPRRGVALDSFAQWRGAFQNNPTWSPDGNPSLYVYPRDGRGDLGWITEMYLAPAAGRPGRSVTRALDRQMFGAEWMPGGKSILVAANDRASVGLWVQPLEGAREARRPRQPGVNGAFGYDVAVSPKGAIVFTATSASARRSCT
jgi:Tol biopolymer transport system component